MTNANELTTYTMDVQEAKDRLKEIVTDNYDAGEDVELDTLQDLVIESLSDDIIYTNEADTIIYNYGIGQALSELQDGYGFPLNEMPINALAFTAMVVNELRTYEVRELLDLVFEVTDYQATEYQTLLTNIDNLAVNEY